jgi:hypothetical protein
VAEQQAISANARGEPDARQVRSRRGHRGRRTAVASLACVLAVAVVYCCALREASTVVTQSDAASMALQGWAMAHGNVLLHGWRLADVSFYTIEVPAYAIAGLVVGLRPDVVPACAAATFTILVVLAAAVARARRLGLAGAAAAGITTAVMAGPALRVAGTLLTEPDHTGTAVVPLVLALVIDRAGRGWRVAALTCLVLAWGLVEDSLVLLVGVAPVVIVCLARACRDAAAVPGGTPRALGGTPVGPQAPASRDTRHEVLLAGAAVASVAVAEVVKTAIRLAGGWVLDGNGHQVVQGRDLAGNVGGTIQDALQLLSASPLGQPVGPGLILVAIHLALAAMVATACWMALRRLFWSGDMVAVLLAVGIVANLAGYTLLYTTGPPTIQDVAPVFGMGAALAGRVLGGPLASWWQARRVQEGSASQRTDGPEAAARVPVAGLRHAWPLLAAWAAVVLSVGVPPLVTARPAAAANVVLASWLTDHGLDSGIAQYWQANSVMLDSGGAVTMRDVWDYGPARGVRPYPWEEDTSLLSPRQDYANFVIAATHSGLTVLAIEQRFGPPARGYRVGEFTVLVYDRNLLPALSGLPAPWPGRISWLRRIPERGDARFVITIQLRAQWGVLTLLGGASRLQARFETFHTDPGARPGGTA